MSKQRPNPDKMANELAGASAFFKRAPASEPAPAQPPDTANPIAHAPRAAPATTPGAPAMPAKQGVPGRDGRPVRRVMIRHPFELYLDQVDRLRERADQQKRQGAPGSMSKMVRDAIDRLLDEAPAD